MYAYFLTVSSPFWFSNVQLPHEPLWMVMRYRHDMNVVYHRFFILFLFFLLLFLDVNYCYLYLFCNNILASVCLQMGFLFFHVDLITYIIRISPHFIKFNWWKIFRKHPNKKHSANHQANRTSFHHRLLYHPRKKWCDYIFLGFFLFWLQNAINENIFFVISSIRTTHGKHTAISLVVSICSIIIQIAIDSYNTDTNE